MTIENIDFRLPDVIELPKPVPVTHVIFDLDGLLIDSEQTYEKVMQNFCRRHGKEFTWELKKLTLGLTAPVIAAKVIEFLSLPMTPEQLMKEVEDEFPKALPLIRPMPGVEKLLGHLRDNKIPMSIATSSSRKWFSLKTQGFPQDLLSAFHHILHAPEEERVKAAKPAPDTFLVSRKKFFYEGIKEDVIPHKQSFLVFEDSVTGVLAGIRAGMQVVMIPDPRLDIQTIMRNEPELRPTLILPSLEDFKPDLFGLPSF
jgi:pseudouridine-5'-monophosphatase